MVSALHQASYLREKELVALDSGKRTTVGSGGFFVYRQQITRRKKESQDDHWNFFISAIHNTLLGDASNQ